jgi:hypothetical protein
VHRPCGRQRLVAFGAVRLDRTVAKTTRRTSGAIVLSLHNHGPTGTQNSRGAQGMAHDEGLLRRGHANFKRHQQDLVVYGLWPQFAVASVVEGDKSDSSAWRTCDGSKSRLAPDVTII